MKRDGSSIRGLYSRYDYVKVKVWLRGHYYILSRFLMSRQLYMLRIPYEDSIAIVSQLKRQIVDKGLLNISQVALEEELFSLLKSRGYGAKYPQRWRDLIRFHHHRIPFLVLICGSGVLGKRRIAMKLSERLNVPNVCQTGMACDFLGLDSDAFAKHSYPDDMACITAYTTMCNAVLPAFSYDIKKCFKDGKSLLVVGTHLNPHAVLQLVSKQNLAIPEMDGWQGDFEAPQFFAQQSAPGVIIPFLLDGDAATRRKMLENKMLEGSPPGDFAALLDIMSHNYGIIQEHLKQVCPPFIRIQVDAHAVDKTVNFMHHVILEMLSSSMRNLPEGQEGDMGGE